MLMNFEYLCTIKSVFHLSGTQFSMSLVDLGTDCSLGAGADI